MGYEKQKTNSNKNFEVNGSIQWLEHDTSVNVMYCGVPPVSSTSQKVLLIFQGEHFRKNITNFMGKVKITSCMAAYFAVTSSENTPSIHSIFCSGLHSMSLSIPGAYQHLHYTQCYNTQHYLLRMSTMNNSANT